MTSPKWGSLGYIIKAYSIPGCFRGECFPAFSSSSRPPALLGSQPLPPPSKLSVCHLPLFHESSFSGFLFFYQEKLYNFFLKIGFLFFFFQGNQRVICFNESRFNHLVKLKIMHHLSRATEHLLTSYLPTMQAGLRW